VKEQNTFYGGSIITRMMRNPWWIEEENPFVAVWRIGDYLHPLVADSLFVIPNIFSPIGEAPDAP
jgi:hypothetical protein